MLEWGGYIILLNNCEYFKLTNEMNILKTSSSVKKNQYYMHFS